MVAYLLAILSGVALTASFPPPGWSFIAWVALVPFFYAVEGRDWKETFGIAYVCGLSFYWSLFYWLNNVTVAGFFILTLYLALYFPAFGLLVRFVRRRGVPLWCTAPFLWTALEYLRTYAFSGLPWGLIGVSQFLSTDLIQIASITAVYGVSFVIVLVNGVFYAALTGGPRRALVPLGVAVCVLALCLFYGRSRLHRQAASHATVQLAIVQGNVPQEVKFGMGYRREILNRFLTLSRLAARQHPDIIIWPETSVPGYFWYDPFIYEPVMQLVKKTGVPIILGSNHMYDAEQPKYFNSAFFIDASGQPAGRYDKIHLVLFGEIIPCKNLFPFLKRLVPFEEDFHPGEEYTVFPFKDGDFSILICFEDIFPDLARGFVRNGARFLVNVTNDAWFGRSSQPYQHAAHAVFRCVENGIGMARATNTGLSCFIDPHGRMVRTLQDDEGQSLFVTGTDIAALPLASEKTVFTRYGNLFAMLCCVVSLVFVLLSVRSRRRER
jgi:apolipoprotein N-acyltransferase